jgi:hypothetical protein
MKCTTGGLPYASNNTVMGGDRSPATAPEGPNATPPNW